MSMSTTEEEMDNRQHVRDYREGYLQALSDFAWWKDGVLIVGSGVKTLKQAKKDFKKKRKVNSFLLEDQSEPRKSEYIDLPIVQIEEWLGVQILLKDEHFDLLPFPFTHLHCLPSLPGFAGFWTRNKDIQCERYIPVPFERVPIERNEGRAVIARFKIEAKYDNTKTI